MTPPELLLVFGYFTGHYPEFITVAITVRNSRSGLLSPIIRPRFSALELTSERQNVRKLRLCRVFLLSDRKPADQSVLVSSCFPFETRFILIPRVMPEMINA